MKRQITITEERNGKRIAFVVDDKIVTSEFVRDSGQGFLLDSRAQMSRMIAHLECGG